MTDVVDLIDILVTNQQERERSFATDVHSPSPPAGSVIEKAKDSGADLLHRVERALKETAETLKASMSDNLPFDPSDIRQERAQDETAGRVKRAIGADENLDVEQKPESLLHRAKDWISGTTHEGAEKLGHAKDSTVDAAQRAKDATMDAAQRAKDATVDTAHQAQDTASRGAQRVKEGFQDAGSRASDTVGSAYDRAKNLVSQNTDEAQQQAQQAKERAEEAARQGKEEGGSFFKRAKEWIAGTTHEGEEKLEQAKEEPSDLFPTRKRCHDGCSSAR
ncbi:late embryogenesis abundant protein At3g53040-like isoform X2 [Daphnia pulicaria]|uniref:late embryogenesis abundant protein At3g53040-like isoform X2 n=1 Tax=Daphnia pulicaria TaxID=35523 RepID=UPI001EECB372|nr:late embryogenesis abundant protein At3g53040-like isoform X2 [Daphnia pulicaria]